MCKSKHVLHVFVKICFFSHEIGIEFTEIERKLTRRGLQTQLDKNRSKLGNPLDFLIKF